MSPYLYAWIHRKSVSFVKKRRQKAIPPVRDPHPAPKPGSIGETRPRRTTPGFSDPLPDLRSALFGERLLRETVPMGPNPQPDPGATLLLLGEMPFRQTTPEWPNSRPDPIAQEDTPPPAYATLDLYGSPPQNATPQNAISPPAYATLDLHGFTPQNEATLLLLSEMPFREITPEWLNSWPDPIAQEDTPLPAYATLDFRGSTPQNATPQRQRLIYENATLETLRAHNPATRTPRPDSHILEPPPRRTTPYGVASAAAYRTVGGITRAFDEQDPRMVAARTAQTIAVAVSTSRSYTAFLAAVTAAETFALLSTEDSHYQVHVPSDHLTDRYEQAISIATNTAVAANASLTASDPWPVNIHSTAAPERQQPQQQQTIGWTTSVIGIVRYWAFGGVVCIFEVLAYCLKKAQPYVQ